jgi:ariadne-1
LWKKGLRDDAAYELAKKIGGEVLSILEPKLVNRNLSPGYCGICCETAALFNLNCGHSYCYECIQKWITDSITQLSPSIPNCCNQPLASHLDHFLSKPEQEQFHTKILHNTLSSISGFNWCKNCSNGFIIEEESSSHCSSLICKECEYQWCRKCNLQLHSDLTCDEALLRESKETRENRNWIKSNTQQCPHCQTDIEKNSGCNHMTCRQCKFEFCWVCKEKWIPGEPCIH